MEKEKTHTAILWDNYLLGFVFVNFVLETLNVIVNPIAMQTG